MRLFAVLFVILAAAIAYLTFLNQGYLTIYLTQAYAVEVPIVALVLFSMAFGALLVGTGAGIRGAKGLFLRWRAASRQKRETKIQEAYANALNALLSDRSAEAVRLLQRLLDLDPSHGPALLKLGDLRRQQGDLGEAIRLHRKARSLNEHSLEAAFTLVKDLQEAQRLEEAIGVLKDVLKKDERNPQALTWLRDLYVRLGHWEEAHTVQEQVMKATADPEALQRENARYVGIKYELARLYLEKGMRDQARKYLKGTIKLDRGFLPGYIGLGEASIQEGRVDHAAELWEKAYDLTSSVILLHRLEDLFVETGEPEKIIRIYQEAIGRHPSDRVLKFYLGKLYYRLEMLEDAFEQLTAVDAGEERIPDLHKLLGNLYLRQGDFKAAVEEFKKALNLKERVVVPYSCSACGYQTRRWSGRCPQCGLWNCFDASPPLIGPPRGQPPM